MSNILLVRPPFPDARNNKYNSVPLGLLKISAWKKSLGDEIYYINGNLISEDLPEKVDEIYVTSMFSYWSDVVITSANLWHTMYPQADVYVGGIATTLIPEYFMEKIPYANIVIGYHKEANGFSPDYSILPINDIEVNNSQIIHTQRGCYRSCGWCGVWKIEPDIIFYEPEDVVLEILKNPERKDVLIYDNNFLSHPKHIKILNEFIELHKTHKMRFMLTQGFDDRLLTQEIANLAKAAGFYQPRFSYDHEGQADAVRRSIQYFVNVGYKPHECQVFIIVNNIDTPKTIENRYIQMYQLGVSIHSDRYRKLDSTYDNYDGTIPNQTSEDYYINTEHGWDDAKIKGMLQLMSKINYVNRHNCMFIEHDYYQKASLLNKGKSSHKLNEYICDTDV